MCRASIVSNEMMVLLVEIWTSTIAPCLDKLSLQLETKRCSQVFKMPFLFLLSVCVLSVLSRNLNVVIKVQ